MADSKLFMIPFGASGDRAAIPETVSPSGAVSWPQGFGPDYERDPATDPMAKRVPRDETNEYLYQITNAIKQIQLRGLPEWFSDNGLGGPVPYPLGARVTHGGMGWVSLTAANITEPGVSGSEWGHSDNFSLANSGLNLLVFRTSGATLNGNPISWTNGGAWAIPDGVTRIKLRAWGAGGGGGGSNGNNSGASGGGGGAYAEASLSVTPGQSVPINVGIGGGAGTGTPTNGGAGGSTSFGSLLSCGGGGGGLSAVGGIQISGAGDGGVATGAQFSVPGLRGSYAFLTGPSHIYGGVGGASFGSQGNTPLVTPLNAAAAGVTGTYVGAGGGGGLCGGWGGGGAAGALIIEY